jgi:endonuclease YncB( thermonuclease family)
LIRLAPLSPARGSSAAAARPADALPPRKNLLLTRALLCLLLAGTALPAAAHHGVLEGHPDQALFPARVADAGAGRERAQLHAKASRQTERTFVARALSIADGDSFEARSADGKKIRIRLAGIDAPEKSQPWANKSREKLREFLGRDEFEVRALKTDPYGRYVALVTAKGEDASLAMLDAGLAWHFERYDSDLTPALRKRYAEAAAAARAERAGLWRDDDPQPPWEFRRRSGNRR